METPSNDTTVAITEVVTAALETPMKELPPLLREVDLTALDRLISSNTGARLPGITVTFTYAGLNVVVHSCGIVYATPIEDEGNPVHRGISTRERDS